MSGSLSQLLHIELDYLNSKLKEIESELARCLEFKKKIKRI